MLTNQLMMDWLDIRSGGEECILTKQYLDAAIDTESGAGFNTLDEKDEVSSDSDDDHGKDKPSTCHKRGRGRVSPRMMTPRARKDVRVISIREWQH